MCIRDRAGIAAVGLNSNAAANRHRLSYILNHIIGISAIIAGRSARFFAAGKCAALQRRRAIVDQRRSSMAHVVYSSVAGDCQRPIVGDGVCPIRIGQRDAITQIQLNSFSLRNLNAFLCALEQCNACLLYTSSCV